MIHDIFIPGLFNPIAEVKIVRWLKSARDRVEEGDTLLVIKSDNADMECESFWNGYLAAILYETGQVASIFAPVALLTDTEAEIELAQELAKLLKSSRREHLKERK